jgi:hypothetical protein
LFRQLFADFPEVFLSMIRRLAVSKSNSDEATAKRNTRTVVTTPEKETASVKAGAQMGEDEDSKLTFDEAAAEEEYDAPLSAEEFRAILRKVDRLGLTWTTDLPPSVKAKSPKQEHALYSEKLDAIQSDYPGLSDELGHIVWCTITGTEAVPEVVGSKDVFEQKAEMVREMIISPEFRSEFFFKHMLKVPYFLDLDWEVIVKIIERSVRVTPGTTYALVSLLTHSNVHGLNEAKHVTFAVDEQRIGVLINTLLEVREALKKARPVAESHARQHEKQDGGAPV